MNLIKIFVIIGITVNSVSCFPDNLFKKLLKIPEIPDFRSFSDFWGTQVEVWNEPDVDDKPALDYFVFVLTWPITPYWGYSKSQMCV